MVLTNHFVAEEFEYAGHAVANDGRAQVADVHLFGQVRRRQVDHGALRRTRLAHADLVIGQGGIQASGQGLGVLEEIEEARAGDFGFGDVFVSRRAAMIFSARSRGFMRAGFASIIAMLLAKSP